MRKPPPATISIRGLAKNRRKPGRFPYAEWRMTASAPSSARILLRSSFSSAPTYLRICIPLVSPLLGRDHAQGLDPDVLDDFVVGQDRAPRLDRLGQLPDLGAHLGRAQEPRLVSRGNQLRELLLQALADPRGQRGRERQNAPPLAPLRRRLDDI